MKNIVDRILLLKKERDAVILAHYYVSKEIQNIADYVGDSYFLSKKAMDTPHKTIVLCGVLFMGESAKILNPEKTVIMPDKEADCPMAYMVNTSDILNTKKAYEDLAVVCYINSTAETKSVSDVCVTSSNAVSIVKALPNKNIFFVPDKHLGKYVSEQVPNKNFIFNDGYCHVHQGITKSGLTTIKNLHPKAKILAHPETSWEILQMADYIGSTSGILDYATTSNSQEFIVCTEEGIRYMLESANPDKQFYFPLPIPTCKNMKKITLEKIENALENMCNTIELDEEVRIKAEKSLKRMHQLGK